MESVIVRLAGEHFNLSLKRKGGKERLTVSSNVSKVRKDTEDKVEMLSIIKHYEQYGQVVSGDINRMRALVLGEEPTMFNNESLTNPDGVLIYN